MSKVYIALTDSALETIQETLAADCVSSYFDNDLRNEIAEAVGTMEIVTPIPAMLQACKNALADLEGYTYFDHRNLPTYKRTENPTLTTIRELTAAIKAAEPEWE